MRMNRPSGTPVPPRVFAVLCIFILTSVFFTMPATAGTLGVVEYGIDYTPSDFAANTTVNRASSVGTQTSFDSWPTDREGVYVGSYTPETSLRHPHAIEEPTIAFFNLSFDMEFSPTQLQSGSGGWRMRLPFSIDDSVNVNMSVFDNTNNRTVVSGFILRAFDQTGATDVLFNSMFEYGDRAYVDLLFPILSNIEYTFNLRVQQLLLGAEYLFYTTNGDIADDGETGFTVSMYDEFSGVPGWSNTTFATDPGVSFLFVEGMPSTTYIGLPIGLEGTGENHSLQLWIQSRTLNNATGDLIVFLPVFNRVDADITAFVNVTASAYGATKHLFNGTLTWRDGYLFLFRDVQFTSAVNTTSTNLVITIVINPLDTQSDDLVVLGRQPDAFNVDGFLCLSCTGGILWAKTNQSQPFPLPDIASANLTGFEPLITYAMYSGPEGDVEIQSQANEAIEPVAPLKPARFFASTAFNFLRNNAVVRTVAGLAENCRSVTSCANEVRTGLNDAFGDDIDAFTDYVNNGLDQVSDLGTQIGAALDAGWSAISSFGESLVYTLTIIAEKVFLFLSTLLTVLMYVFGIVLIFGSIIATSMVMGAVKLMLRGRPDMIPAYFQGRVTKAEMEDLDRRM